MTKAAYPVATAAALLLAAPLALAQSANNNASNMESNGQNNLGSADRTYLQQDARGSAFELQISQLASQKAQNSQVRQFSQTVVSQHSQANQQLQQVAQQNGMTLPTSLDRQDQRKMSRLRRMSGSRFDQAYLKDMVQANQQDMRQQKQELDTTQNQQIRQVVQQESQLDQQHVQAAEALRNTVTGKT